MDDCHTFGKLVSVIWSSDFSSFIFCSEKHFGFIGKAWFRRATLSYDSSYLHYSCFLIINSKYEIFACWYWTNDPVLGLCYHVLPRCIILLLFEWTCFSKFVGWMSNLRFLRYHNVLPVMISFPARFRCWFISKLLTGPKKSQLRLQQLLLIQGKRYLRIKILFSSVHHVMKPVGRAKIPLSMKRVL